VEDQEVQGIKLRSFASLCFMEAFKTSIEKTDWIVLAVGGVLGLLAFLIPSWERTMTKAILLLPLSAFASVGIFRIFLSPLLVYRSREVAAHTTEESLRKVIAVHEQTIGKQNEAIRAHAEKRKRTPAEQHHYEKAKQCLERFGSKAVLALRHLKTCGSITVSSPGMSGSTSYPTAPEGITLAEMNWVLGACSGYGVVVIQESRGGNERTYEIAKPMDSALNDLLYTENATTSAG
jgi:hypothetical protein